MKDIAMCEGCGEAIVGPRLLCKGCMRETLRDTLERIRRREKKRIADARRTAVEECCRAVCEMCRDGEPVDERGIHPGRSIKCKANAIRKAVSDEPVDTCRGCGSAFEKPGPCEECER